MTDITNIILLLLPLIMLQMGLMIYALIKAIKQTNFKYLSKLGWIIIIIVINIIGPVLYLIMEGENN